MGVTGFAANVVAAGLYVSDNIIGINREEALGKIETASLFKDIFH